jgi:integrase
MASISCDANGTKRVCFSGVDGKQKAIRLGHVSIKAAEYTLVRIEALLQDKVLRRPHEPELAAWLRDLHEPLHTRLVRAGLTSTRTSSAHTTLGDLVKAFFAGVSVKPSSLVRMQQAKVSLLAHFGEAREVSTIRESDAEVWRSSLASEGYAQATISRTVLYARQMFRWAVRRGMALANPFAELKAGTQVNRARSVFIDQATIAKVIDAAPDAEWRLLIALSRFGGLRVPSEALALRWSDVDWANSRLTVRSPKTEHHEGRAERIVPIFAEVLPHLRAAFEAAMEGEQYIIRRYREGANLNTHLRRIVLRAGIKPWDRTWHNLRASRQTELAATYPLHTVCSWIGNTKAIAAGHYLQVTDADWKRATDRSEGVAQSGAPTSQTASQRASASDGTGRRYLTEPSVVKVVAQTGAKGRTSTQNKQMGRAGLVLLRIPRRKSRFLKRAAAETAASSPGLMDGRVQLPRSIPTWRRWSRHGPRCPRRSGRASSRW